MRGIEPPSQPWQGRIRATKLHPHFIFLITKSFYHYLILYASPFFYYVRRINDKMIKRIFEI